MTRTIDGHLVRDPHDLHAEQQAQLQQAENEVERRVGGKYESQTVREAVLEAYEELADEAKIESFLPILTARAAEQKLAERG
ncbi:hypothetical protein BBK82_14315 [Lentzea guizhouensis]|uniref:Protein-tyrosine-phosphatase-like N-terminal domain-containing protein n=1 Tax=Lentzea guizhouensis TaxID=1586287 RepID=A0A1B2HH71_9PSEU|nr:hypothetical protein [Lentzea guizhouensis]ANZ37065.1 hypothetical protein BBK82_14315 [Lentzea guizhouensis]